MKTLKQLQEKWEHPYSGPNKYSKTPGTFEADDTVMSKPYPNMWSDMSSDELVYVNSLHDRLSQHTNHIKKATGIDHNIIQRYTNSSESINKHLLGDAAPPHLQKVEIEPGLVPHLNNQVDQISKLISHHQTPEDLHVYSGVGYSPADYHDKNSSGPIKVHLPAFTSTSIHPLSSLEFVHGTGITKEGQPAGHVIKIHVPEGSHGMYTSPISEYPNEKELLLHRNAKLHIDPTPTKMTWGRWARPPGKEDGDLEIIPHTLHIWHAKLVHDGIKPTRHTDEDT